MSKTKLKKSIYCKKCVVCIEGEKYEINGISYITCKKCKKQEEDIRNDKIPIEYIFKLSPGSKIQTIHLYYKDIDLIINQLERIKKTYSHS